jgi:ABC-type sugar transport system substrate-binding protein
MRMKRSSVGRPRRATGIAALLPVLLAVAFTSTATGTDATKAGAADVAQARAILAAASKRPTSIGLTAAVGRKIPTGKKIVYISCATISACTAHIKYIGDAAKKLGWSASMITTDGSPQQQQAAFESALRSGASGIILTGFVRANLETQVQEAKAKGVPVSVCCSTDPIGNGVIYNTSTVSQNGRIGKYLAAKVVADTNGKASVLYVNVSAFPILAAVGTSFEQWLGKLCTSCKYDSIDIALSALGKGVPDTVVSYIRAHPDTNYVVLSESGSLAPGLSAALSAAGLSKVKIIGQGPGIAEFQEIRSGSFEGGVPFDFQEIDWMMVDAIVRYQAHAPVKLTAPPLWFITKQNVPQTTGLFPIVPNYKAQFLKLWGKK